MNPYVLIGFGLFLVIRSLPRNNTVQFGKLSWEQQKAYLLRPLTILNILRIIGGIFLITMGFNKLSL
jgi:hypothetical protein